MMIRVVFWDILPCKMIVDRRFRGAYCLHHPWWQLWTSYSPPWELEISRFSSSLCVQTTSGVHPASYPTDTGGPFPGDKVRPERDADHSSPSSAEVKNE
jgi:hypothetical protein